MRTKDHTVETGFHPVLTGFLFQADKVYRAWNSELTITSGTEHSTRHSYSSLHYATPGQAADIRIWQIEKVPPADVQLDALQEAAGYYCDSLGIPHSWVDIVLESDHLHCEYQPKRRD